MQIIVNDCDSIENDNSYNQNMYTLIRRSTELLIIIILNKITKWNLL